uniref:PAR14-like first RRM domain-containing protein n=1 Tax=Sinocyclocheilus rhinocerous TaxID=307959 RepID=A0A673GC46_9TELE
IAMDEYYPIIVEGDWGPEHAKSVKNKLQIYFQSKKKSQGGDCVVQYDDGSNSATILEVCCDWPAIQLRCDWPNTSSVRGKCYAPYHTVMMPSGGSDDSKT